MFRPKASNSGPGVPLVAGPSRSGHWEVAGKAFSPEVLGMGNLIVLDSEDESEPASFKRSPTSFGSSRGLDKAALLLFDQKAMRSHPESSESRKMKHSRKRVLAVEDSSGASRFDSKSFQASPSTVKRSTFEGNFPRNEDGTPTADLYARTTAVPEIESDTNEKMVKAKRKRESGAPADLEMQSGTPEHAEQENKENNGTDVHGGNGVKSEAGGKKRKKDTGVDPESSSKPGQSQLDLPADGSVPGEGKTCHQCRQRLGASLAWCRDSLGKRACTRKYCGKCLQNRYGEIVAEVQDRDTWSCPRCRGICNCSMCMKKKGLAPTGGLAKKAKAAGYSSVAELLERFPNMREERYSREENAADASNTKDVMRERQASILQPLIEDDDVFQANEAGKKNKQVKDHGGATESVPPGSNGSEGMKKKRRRRKKCEIAASVVQVEGDRAEGQTSVVDLQNGVEGKSVTKKKKKRKSRAKFRVEGNSAGEHMVCDSALVAPGEEEVVEEEIVLPTGTPLVNIGGLDFPPEAVGPALQILEFCSAFEKPLKLKRVKAQKILSEMVRGGTLRRGNQSDLIQLHVLLISIILDDEDDDTNVAVSPASKNCWIYHLGRHLNEQFCQPKKAGEDVVSGGDDDDDRRGSASTSGTKYLPSPLWPVRGEKMRDVIEALKSGVEGYANLSITTRLQILATLCDDTLSTKKMRDYLEKVISTREIEQKENREELLALRKQVMEVHENEANEVRAAKRDGGGPIVRDLTRVQREYAELAEKEAQLTEVAAKLCGPRCDAVRTDKEAVHSSGSRFWRLKGVKDREVVVLQGISNFDHDLPNEDWSIFSEDQEEEVLQCVTNLNTRKKAPVKTAKKKGKRKAPVQVDRDDPTKIESISPETGIPIIELSD